MTAYLVITACMCYDKIIVVFNLNQISSIKNHSRKLMICFTHIALTFCLVVFRVLTIMLICVDGMGRVRSILGLVGGGGLTETQLQAIGVNYTTQLEVEDS